MPTSRKRDIACRTLLTAAAAATAVPAAAEECRVGPPPHDKGPLVWMDYDQVELDAAYDQLQYAPLMGQNVKRQASLSEEVRGRLGEPLRRQYGQTKIEELDVYRTNRENAPVFVFIHGGAWLVNSAKNNGFQAELFVNAGIQYVALDFINVKEAGGDLSRMAEQVSRSIAWVYQNAASFGGDRDHLYVGGFSSGWSDAEAQALSNRCPFSGARPGAKTSERSSPPKSEAAGSKCECRLRGTKSSPARRAECPLRLQQADIHRNRRDDVNAPKADIDVTAN
jgi:arylformamidase